MKTERVTLLTSPDFKNFLGAEAQREGVSVAELVRTRCERRPTEDEAILAALTLELNAAVVAAQQSMTAGLDEARSVLAELRARRAGGADHPPAVAPKRLGRKAAGVRA